MEEQAQGPAVSLHTTINPFQEESDDDGEEGEEGNVGGEGDDNREEDDEDWEEDNFREKTRGGAATPGRGVRSGRRAM